MKVPEGFYQFALAALAMICLVILFVAGHGDKSEIVSPLSAIMGAGFWGGLQRKGIAPLQPKMEDGQNG